MSSAAHESVVRGPGESTAFEDEPATEVGTGNLRYQLDTDAKRLLDPSVAVVVEVDPDGESGFEEVAPEDYTVDYLFGIITFLEALGDDAEVRVSASYVPVIDLAGVTDATYTASREVLDDTTINAGPDRTKKLGLKDLTGSFTLLELLSYDHDPGAGELILQDAIDDGTPLLFEHEAGGKRFRAWVLLESSETGAEVSALINTTVNFTLAAQAVGAGYSWEP